MTVIDDLKAAKAELVTRGRHTGSLVGPYGRICLLGAIGAATLENFLAFATHNPREAFSDLASEQRPRAVVGALLPHVGRPLWGGYTEGEPDPTEWLWAFNDDKATTDQDVLDLFDKALADLGGL